MQVQMKGFDYFRGKEYTQSELDLGKQRNTKQNNKTTKQTEEGIERRLGLQKGNSKQFLFKNRVWCVHAHWTGAGLGCLDQAGRHWKWVGRRWKEQRLFSTTLVWEQS